MMEQIYVMIPESDRNLLDRVAGGERVEGFGDMYFYSDCDRVHVSFELCEETGELYIELLNRGNLLTRMVVDHVNFGDRFYLELGDDVDRMFGSTVDYALYVELVKDEFNV